MPPSPTSSRIAPTVEPLIQSSLKIAAIIMQLGKKSATACRRRARSRTINRMRSNTISNPRKALSKKIFSRRPVATRR